MSDAARKKFMKLVRQLGRFIRAEADAGLAVPELKAKAKPQARAPLWVSAYLDARWYSDAKGWNAKIRVVLPSGNLHSLRTTDDMDTLLDKLWDVRKEDSSAEWYGLKVIVSHDGGITTEFDNDPNCVIDPTWYKS